MAGTRYGLEDVAGYDPVQLLAYRDAINASNGNPQPDRHFLWVEVARQRGSCAQLGVRYYVAQEGQVLRKLTVVLRTPTATVAARRQGAADRTGQPPGAARMRRASSCASPTASWSRPRPGRRAGSCWPIRRIPGWSVTVDGSAATARVQNGLFRAVDLPAGRHRVEWRFQPRSVERGL